MKVFICFLFFSVFFISCKKEVKAIDTNTDFVVDTTKIKIKTIKPIVLNPQAKKEVSSWIEYQNINEFIPNFYQTDSKQALFDSQRILELSKQLQDSIRVDKLNTPSFRARLHVLYNESFRLADMDSIKSITPNEVALQTKNIVNAFDAINSKLNMLVSQDKLEENLKEFDSVLNKSDTSKKVFKPFLKKDFKKGKPKRINPLQYKTRPNQRLKNNKK